MNLLPVVAVSANDFPQAERLLDLIAIQRNKTPSGYILIVAAPDVHPEQHKRLTIAAKIGFEHVGLLPVGWKKESGKGKYEQMNHVFRSAAAHIGRHFKEPFVWLEPDSIPVVPDWLEMIADEYERQPKLYLGPVVADDKGNKFLGRVAVYPRDCSLDINSHCDGKPPFEIAAGQSLVNRATKSKSFQQLVIQMPEDCEKVRPDAVIVHGDKLGILLAATLEKFSAVKPISDMPVKAVEGALPNPIPSYMVPEEILKTCKPPFPPAVKIDGRTKAGREARKAMVAA